MATNENDSVVFDKQEYRAKLYEHLSELTKQVNFVNYPINPKITYDYPDLNEIILINIMNALVVFPKFYTQTLHLMNKMNLPCPLVNYVRKYDKTTVLNELNKANKLHLIKLNLNNLNESIQRKEEAQTSSPTLTTQKQPRLVKQRASDQIVEEEDDDDDGDENAHEQKDETTHQVKVDFTKDLEKKKFNLKSLAKPGATNLPGQKSAYDLNDVFESGSKNVLAKRKINITEALKTTTLQKPSEEKPEETIQSEKETTESLPDSSLLKSDQTSTFITIEELETKRLKIAELKELPVFKNYALGEKTNKIYIKNVAKKIQDQDLKHIYGRYVNWSDEIESSAFEIRLMKEGRMKGQAFVTFASEETAERAINETNGLVLDGKPIIVQYGRSTTSSDGTR